MDEVASSEREYRQAINRLRAIRLAAGMTLRDVEKRSGGDWKAVVVGSYERGTRHLSLLRAVELCRFYGADLSALGLGKEEERPDSAKIIFDLRRLNEQRKLPDPFVASLSRLLSRFISSRNDFNGEVLTIRASDLESFAILSQATEQELRAALERRGLLFKTSL